MDLHHHNYISDLIIVLGLSPLTISDQIVVFYWSHLRRKMLLRLVPGFFMLLHHVCGIVCPLSCVIFNHYVISNENLRPTFFRQVRTLFIQLYFTLYIHIIWIRFLSELL